ncbi:alanine racemase [Planococcus sp. N028]|uniref:Alanine racemase n=1 Tax=Planococcus shixiaomingii TaxID=3058393 RepID=A0ABT8N670_9BACL|nr:MULTISPECIES: alanine racemase [unclassified Planococcus (in: firmicutes)]MDN7243386.1 alanine racemase [Planococcus sp. N028]WKA55326.1 alanine racemase [Planococcus sp. N022]
MTQYYRPTKAVIDLTAIEQNLQAFKERDGKAEIIAVVKADAYGHGMVEVARKALETGVKWLAVATPDEALFLMDNAIKANCLVMGHTPAAFIPVAQRTGIAVAAISLDWLALAAEAVDPDLPSLKIHLKVDTGMRRVGIQAEEVEEALRLIERHSFSFDGLFTHFATADEDRNDLFQRQVSTMASIVKKINNPSLMVHVSNSAAAIMHPELAFNAVRVGISLYGIAPSSYVENNMPFALAPALGLETEIVHIKRVKAGETISYGATYRCEQDEWIATLPIGYADGMLRGLQGQEVLVRGVRMPIVGRICMDQCMIRLPEKMPVGEKVQLIGRQAGAQIRIEEWAEKLGTIAYEIPVNLTKRVPRIYC